MGFFFYFLNLRGAKANAFDPADDCGADGADGAADVGRGRLYGRDARGAYVGFAEGAAVGAVFV